MIRPSSLALRLGAVLGLVLGLSTPAAAQTPPPPLDRPLRVFIDCRGPGCDSEFFKKELHWMDHMRDQTDADVHVLVTTEPTGGGGVSYSVQMIGRARWEGQQDLLRISTEAGETSDGQRRALLRVFSLLLARYAVATPVGAKLALQPVEASTTAGQTKAEDDPWNYWVYRINFNSFLNGQQNDKSGNFNFNTSANHTTDDWKININAGFNYSESRFVLSDGTFSSYRRGRNLNTLVVKSLSDHWSAGGMVRMGRSTFNNQRLSMRIAPGFEYNFFPYKESTTRRFTLQWTAGLVRFKYDQETIFGKLEETHWDEQVLAIFSLDKPWGNVGVTGEVAHLFDDVGKYRTSVFMDANIRLFRGFSFNVFGDYSVLHDQLYLPRAGASDEEIIARQQQLQTNYRYFMSVGITYRFGSINNNIVNQRFGGG